MLAATQRVVEKRGHHLNFIASGPAVSIWRRAGFEVLEASAASDLDDITSIWPDIVVTGSGFNSFEGSFWQWAKPRERPTIAVIDSWTSLARRFKVPGGFEFPDAIGVIDEESRLQLIAETDCPSPIHTIGQPHLQNQTANLSEACAKPGVIRDVPRIVFLSEPIDVDYGREARGFDQYEAFEQLCSVLAFQNVLKLEVKPHPRESEKHWRRFIAQCQTHVSIEIGLTKDPIELLLVEADGLLGMTTMALLEAHLLGRPILSLQPGRTKIVNPIIDTFCNPVVDSENLASHLMTFQKNFGQVCNINQRFAKILHKADERAVTAMESLIRI